MNGASRDKKGIVLGEGDKLPPVIRRMWWVGMSLCVVLSLGLLYSVTRISIVGIGLLGVNNSVLWGWDIVNFIFWIGIGHAGTLISAILLITRQGWRSSVSRIAEAMTLFAVLCAMVFPLFHMGRVWLAWFFIPVPEPSGMWQNLLSPLMWDAFAVGTYFVMSCVFFYVCMIPDLGYMGHAISGKWGRILCRLSWGWIGDTRQQSLYKHACLVLAGLLSALVVSVHSVVSYDFAVTLVPHWHTSLFPPYFVLGAILGGLAMVLIVVIPLQKWGRMRKYMKKENIQSLAKLLLAISLSLGVFYGLEQLFSAMAGQNQMEMSSILILMILANIVVPQVLWIPPLRKRSWVLFLVALVITLGMWGERFFIVVGAMLPSRIPAAQGIYAPSSYDIMMFVGTFGVFFGLTMLFCRFFPSVNVHEVLEERHYEQVARVSDSSSNKVLEEREGEISPYIYKKGWFGRMEYAAFIGACGGFLCGIIFAYYTQVSDYPHFLFGRKAELSSFVGFFPVIFEMTILGAGLSCFVRFLRALVAEKDVN